MPEIPIPEKLAAEIRSTSFSCSKQATLDPMREEHGILTSDYRSGTYNVPHPHRDHQLAVGGQLDPVSLVAN